MEDLQHVACAVLMLHLKQKNASGKCEKDLNIRQILGQIEYFLMTQKPKLDVPHRNTSMDLLSNATTVNKCVLSIGKIIEWTGNYTAGSASLVTNEP